MTLLEAEKRLTVAQEDIFRVRSEFTTTENGLEFQRKELNTLEVRLQRLTAEVTSLEQRQKECTAQRELLELRRESGSSDAAGEQAGLEQAEAKLEELQRDEEQLGLTLEARRKELFSTLSEAAQFKNRFENAQKRLSGVAERLDRHAREEAQLGERKVLLTQKLEALEKDVVLGQQQQEGLQVELSTLRGHEEQLKTALPEVEKLWQSRRDELNRSSARLHSLKELDAQFAGFGQGVRTVMKDASLRSRFSGVLADVIQAPPELEAALESALAERLQCLLCGNEGDAIAAVESLKSSSGGRASFALPLDGSAAQLSDISGALPLLEQIQSDGPYAGLIRQLLSTTLLVDDLFTALKLSRQYPDLTFVTRSGDMTDQGGLVSGGSSQPVGSGLIHKKREIRELELLVTSLKDQTAALGSQRDDLRHQNQEIAEGLKAAAARLHQEELRLTVLQKDRQQAGVEISRITERLEIQEDEKETLVEEKGALEAELKLSGDQACLAGNASKELELETARLKSGLDERRVQLSAARELVTAIRVRIATIREQHDSGLRALADLEQQAQDMSERLASDRQELENGSANRVQLQKEIAAATENMELLVHKQLQAERQLAVIRAAFEEAGSTLNAIETQLKESREQGDTVRQTQADLQLRFSTLTMQGEHLEQNLLERSRIPMTEAVARLNATDFEEAPRRARQVDLQRLLDELGEVNLMAIEECAGMEERFNFLTGQKDDLEESLRTLQQAIQRINRTTRQRFLETYNLINAKFQEVFPRLFCGGRAELHLTDEEDLLETGIDIIVQPPGKKLQNVTLLSGGEKALTAVALIFSIFLIKPTPFCLLDEVDAPLDDANIGRFNEMVREMSTISQFIIITHNKATMQVADTLYGITMEEPGASRMVSVRLH